MNKRTRYNDSNNKYNKKDYDNMKTTTRKLQLSQCYAKKLFLNKILVPGLIENICKYLYLYDVIDFIDSYKKPLSLKTVSMLLIPLIFIFLKHLHKTTGIQTTSVLTGWRK